jgi:malate dehydrogenase (oxaloacetate-decarboxylating)
MFMAAAKALAGISPARENPKHNLLPRVSALRDVAVTVAFAVALQGQKEGLAPNAPIDTIEERIRARLWTPTYRHYRRAGGTEP